MKKDKSIIQRAQDQDQKAFNEIFNLYWDYLFNFQLKRTANQELAEEISLQTFARAFDRINTFNNRYKFKTWLSTISINIHNDLIRKENKKSTIKTISYGDQYDNVNMDNNPSPEEILITNQSLESVLNKIKSLNNDYRRILQLRFFEDLSYKEISKKMDQPINTIKVKLLRAKKLLIEKIEEDAE